MSFNYLCYNFPMKENILNIAYTLLIGLFITLFVGIGIAAFYQEPSYPEYPTTIESSDTLTEESSYEMIQYEKASKQYEEDIDTYNTNVSIILLVAGLIILGASFIANSRKNIFADSLLIGAIGTLLYGTIRGLSIDNLKLTFVYVTVSLLALAFVGFHRFGQPKPKTVSDKSRLEPKK